MPTSLGGSLAATLLLAVMAGLAWYVDRRFGPDAPDVLRLALRTARRPAPAPLPGLAGWEADALAFAAEGDADDEPRRRLFRRKRAETEEVPPVAEEGAPVPPDAAVSDALWEGHDAAQAVEAPPTPSTRPDIDHVKLEPPVRSDDAEE